MKDIARFIAVLGIGLCAVGMIGCCIRTVVTGDFSNGPISPGYYLWIGMAIVGALCLIFAGLVAEESYASLLLGCIAVGVLVAGLFDSGLARWLGESCSVPKLLCYPTIYGAAWLLMFIAMLSRNKQAA